MFVELFFLMGTALGIEDSRGKKNIEMPAHEELGQAKGGRQTDKHTNKWVS